MQGCTDLVNEMIDDLSKSCLEIEKLAQQEHSDRIKKKRKKGQKCTNTHI